MGNSLTLTIKNRMQELGPLSEKVQAFLEPLELPPRAAYVVDLAVEEMVTNIMKYGYDDEDVHEIVVRVDTPEREIRVTLEDDGHEFDPLQVPEPEKPDSIHERKIGGLGIHLVRNMASGMTYRREADRNILEIRVGVGTE